MPNIPIILLAAGASSRMGTSKALLEWKGETLIESRIKTLLTTNQSLVVVLGSKAEHILPYVEKLKCDYVVNEDWESGMSTSIAFGVKNLIKEHQPLDGVLITTIDQPLVDRDHLLKMIALFKKNHRQIIVSKSNKGWTGIPVLFDSYYTSELCELTGDAGAKSIVQKHSDNLLRVMGGENLVDVDTPKQYEELKKSSS